MGHIKLSRAGSLKPILKTNCFCKHLKKCLYQLHLLRKFVFSESEGSQNWEAVDAKAAESDKKRFYINVCHKIIQEGAASSCSEDAAICAVGQCAIRDPG